MWLTQWPERQGDPVPQFEECGRRTLLDRLRSDRVQEGFDGLQRPGDSDRGLGGGDLGVLGLEF